MINYLINPKTPPGCSKMSWCYLICLDLVEKSNDE